MFLFFFIFSIIGMTLFGFLKRNFYLKRHANWEDFPNSMLLLFRMSGGENWNAIMRECMNQLSCMLVTDPRLPIYGQWYNKLDPIITTMTVDQYDDHCSPSPEGTIFFFLFEEMILAYLMVNLFIAVILDNFQRTDADDLPVTRQQVTQFIEAWSTFDPHATYWIPSASLEFLLATIEPPMGVMGMDNMKPKIQALVMTTVIPEHNGKIHFLETLHALSARIAGTALPPDQESSLLRGMASRVPRVVKDMTAPGPRYLVAQYMAALHVQAAVRGYLSRHYEAQSKITRESSGAGLDGSRGESGANRSGRRSRRHSGGAAQSPVALALAALTGIGGSKRGGGSSRTPSTAASPRRDAPPADAKGPAALLEGKKGGVRLHRRGVAHPRGVRVCWGDRPGLGRA